MGRPIKTQLIWTRLSQGFKNSPTLFGEALAVDLAAFPRETLNCTLLQYVDDLLLASPTQGDCWRGTKALLALLSTTGYKVSWKKAQICRQEVKYLGSVISKGTSGARTREKASHLFNTLAEHRKRSPWVPRGCWILPNLDTGFL